MKKKITTAMVFAIVLTLAIGGVAVAASMGVFGQQSGNEMNEQSRERLLRLDEAAETYDDTQVVKTSEAPDGAKDGNETLYDALLARQYGRRFQLTLNQAYCDGYKLYYSYTLTTDTPLQRTTGEGAPSGITEWDMEEAGRKYAEVWSAADEEETKKNNEFFAEHPVGYITREHMAIGDGASLGGKPLNIYDSGETYSDDQMIQGFQEVELPEGYTPGEEIEIELSVHSSASVIYQDEKGVRSAYIADPETRGFYRVPFTVKLNGETKTYTGSVTTSAYSAVATVRVSDVDISGEVVFDAPEWVKAFQDMTDLDCIASYHLIADGVELSNRDGAFGVNADGKFVVGIRYDLPASMDSLVLVPTSSGVEQPKQGETPEDEQIILTP